MRRNKGFTLVSVLIGLALASVAIFAMLNFSGKMQRLDIQDTAIKQQAQELKILTEAVRSYVNANQATWLNGSRRVIALSDLTSAGFLPASFATRYNVAGTGTTPLGQRYRAISIKADATVPPVVPGTVRSIILQDNAPLTGALEHLYVANNTTDILGFQRKVAVIGNRDHRLITGVLPQGSASAQGVGGAFTKDLTAWLAGTAAAPFSVTFLGFPDLGDDGGSGPQGYPVGDCVVSPARAFVGNLTLLVEQACPAAYPVNAGSWPHCRYAGGPVSVALPLIGTAVTLVETVEHRYELTYAQCEPYARQIAGCTPTGTIFDPCSANVQSIANQCAGMVSTYRSTAATLNSGNLNEPQVCYADRPFINSQNQMQTDYFQYQNPSARDKYCCKPPSP